MQFFTYYMFLVINEELKADDINVDLKTLYIKSYF
jgi:hypothetical protein